MPGKRHQLLNSKMVRNPTVCPSAIISGVWVLRKLERRPRLSMLSCPERS